MTTYTVKPIESDPPIELISLAEVKDFLSIDYDDFDDLLGMLLKSAIAASQKSTGLHYTPVTVTVVTDECDNSYPVQPFPEWFKGVESEPMPNSYFVRTYDYVAGFTAGELPDDLRQAILQRVADGFKYREDTQEAALHATSNASVFTEFSYRSNPMI